MSKTLHYNFAVDKSLAARLGPTLDITRATDASYRDSTGTIQTASSGVARFDHDENGTSLGLLIEEARTNICLQSEDITDAEWSDIDNSTFSADATSAPDG